MDLVIVVYAKSVLYNEPVAHFYYLTGKGQHFSAYNQSAMLAPGCNVAPDFANSFNAGSRGSSVIAHSEVRKEWRGFDLVN